jgi:hypothetical protein
MIYSYRRISINIFRVSDYLVNIYEGNKVLLTYSALVGIIVDQSLIMDNKEELNYIENNRHKQNQHFDMYHRADMDSIENSLH